MSARASLDATIGRVDNASMATTVAITTFTPTVKPADDRRQYRLTAIDALRGLVIVIMALDHVRDHTMLGSVQDPTADPTIGPLLFATRWITHFCAPTFVLLAGTSVGLMLSRKSRGALVGFLIKRGVWLILFDLVVISTAFSFAPGGLAQFGGRTFVQFGVLSAIGSGLIVLAGAQFLGTRGCLVLGCAIIAGHNLLDAVWPVGGWYDQGKPLWVVLHTQEAYDIGPIRIVFIYPALAWIGVVLLGFGSASIFQKPAAQRNALLLRLGIGLTCAFILLRALGIYGDPRPWNSASIGSAHKVMSFLATTKYPPSLQYLLMTLGPAAILCAFADRITGRVKDVFVMFGRVPMAFYAVHFFLIHLISVFLGVFQGFGAQQMFTLYRFFPSGFGVSLAGVYLIWAIVIALMFPWCKWVASLKTRRSDWWLSYV
jgi:uncharacterized membrane protein